MPPAGTFCRFDAGWTALRGMAFGLRQPTIVGGAEAMLPDGFDFRPLDDAMSAHLDEPAPEPAAGGGSAYALMVRVLHWTGAIQRRHRIAASDRFHAAPAGSAPGGGERFVLALPYLDRDAASAALNWVRHGVLDYLEHGVIAPDEATARRRDETLKRRIAPRSEPGINTFRFLRAADREGIPVTAIARGLYAFGIGRPSRWLYSSLLDSTSAIATTIARDKLTCASILREAGLPGPEHLLAADAGQAVEAARKLGYPVVVKPRSLDQGAGVAAGLMGDDEVRAAYAFARTVTDEVLVEKHFEGADYRIVVHDGRVVQVFGRRPGGVTGDGRHGIADLVELQLRQQDVRERERIFGKRLLALDEEALDLLRMRGLGPGSVVAAGEFVALRRRSNVSTGGLPVPVPVGSIHPDNAALAVHAAAALRLDFAGVDLIIGDIERSWIDTGALICEVNAMPQLSQLGEPTIYADFLRALLGPRHSIPLCLHLRGDPLPAPEASRASTLAGISAGYASAQGIWIDGIRWTGPQPDSFAAAGALLRQQPMDAAMIHMTPADVLRDGLPAARFRRVVIEQGCVLGDDLLARLTPHVDEVINAPTDPVEAMHEALASPV